MPLVFPSALAYDSQGNLYIADAGAQVVRKLSTAGTSAVVAGTGVQGFAGDGSAATAAQLDSPMGVVVDGSGNLYISDTHNQRVRKVTASTGTISTIAGTGVVGFAGDGAAAAAAALNRPTALAVDAAGNLYIADSGNHRIRKVDGVSGTITTVAGTGIQRFAGDGGSASKASIDTPYGIAVDASGTLYLADTHNGRIRQVDAATGTIITISGTGKAGFDGDGPSAMGASLALPRGVAADADGNLYIADTGNQRVRRISSSGAIATVAGGSVQGFSGDGGPAPAAALDSPGSVAIMRGGLLTFADGANRRIREVDSSTASIDSLPRLSAPPVPVLTLTGPASPTYGSGAVTVKLNGISAGGQSVAIADLTSGASVGLGTVVLDAAGTASWNAATLASGKHLLQATAGATVSQVLQVDVLPLPVTATAREVESVYGQVLRPLTGVVTGVLPQDASSVSITWSTRADPLSPPGTYPISASLTGNPASNYVITSVTGAVVIAKAPSTVSLALSATSLLPGASLVLTPQVASTTSGNPTGSVSLLDGNSLVGVVPVGAAFSTSAIPVGTHALTAAYSGDGNFVGASSLPVVVTVGAPSADFSLTSSGASTQVIASGTAATFQFNVAVQGGALSSPIVLAVKGIPTGATASLSLVSVPPGSSSSSFSLTVQTPRAALESPGVHAGGCWAFVLIPVSMCALRRPRSFRLAILSGSCILLALLPTGCGDRVNSSAGQSHTSSYTVTVTGTATGPSGSALQHSADVTLEVY